MSERDEAEERRLVDVLRPFQLSKLEEYRAKGHWANASRFGLIRMLQIEVDELIDAIASKKPANEVARECADVANFCAMIADIALAREKS